MSNDNPKVPTKQVYIPATPTHAGFYGMTVEIAWVCPVCGGPRGKVFKTVSYDGSRRLYCDGWTNPCGHVDRYSEVRREAGVFQVNRYGPEAER